MWEIAVQNDVERRKVGWFVVNKEMVLALRDSTKPKRCSETANCSKTWRLEKKFVRQNRKEFCYTSRRIRERGPNSHMPFKILSFSLFQFNVSLKLDLSHEFFQQIDHYPFITTFPVLQWKSAKAAFRKQLLLPLKEKKEVKYNSNINLAAPPAA